MAKMRLSVVNFGAANAGLATVGLTVYKSNGTVYASRSTSGVVEYGTNTGVYGAPVAVPEDESVLVLWDTGEATPNYAGEDNNVQLDTIQNETEKIRLIWNSIRNQGEFFNLLMDKLGMIEKNKGLVKGDIEEVVGKAVSEIKFPESPRFPDHSQKLESIEGRISVLSEEVKNKQSSQDKDYSGNFKNLQAVMNGLITSLQNSLRKDNAEKNSAIIGEIRSIQSAFSGLDALLEKITEFSKKLDSIDTNGKEMNSAKRAIQAEIQRLNVLFNMLASTGANSARMPNDLIYSFGHKVK